MIKEIKVIENFEGILELDNKIEFNNFNLIFGDNGSGKTRISRAIQKCLDNEELEKHYFCQDEKTCIILKTDNDEYCHGSDCSTECNNEKSGISDINLEYELFDQNFIEKNLNIEANEKGDKLISIAGYDKCSDFIEKTENIKNELVNRRKNEYESKFNIEINRIKKEFKDYEELNNNTINKILNIAPPKGKADIWEIEEVYKDLSEIIKTVKEIKIISKEKLNEMNKTLKNLDYKIDNFQDNKSIIYEAINQKYEFNCLNNNLIEALLIKQNIFQKNISGLQIIEEYKPEKINFIKQGLDLIKNEQCPFCEQILQSTEEELIKKYEKMINSLEENYYKNLLKHVDTMITRISEAISYFNKNNKYSYINYNSDINKLNNIVSDLKKISEPSFEIEKMKELLDQIKEVKSSLNNNEYYNTLSKAKIEELKEVTIKFNAWVKKANCVYLNNKIEIEKEYKSFYSDNNESLMSKKNNLEHSIKEAQAKNNLTKVKPNIVNLFNNYKNIESINNLIDKLKHIKNEFSSQLETELNDFINTYKKDIQKHYADFHPTGVFDLVEITGKAKNYGGRFRVNINLNVKNSTKRSIEGEKPKKVLSQGHYNSLALAYFLALNNQSKSDIVIFDDPISGLDSNKRLSLISKILEIEKDKQVFVLTHDILFRNYLIETFPEYIKFNTKNCNNSLNKSSYHNSSLVNGVLKLNSCVSIYEDLLKELKIYSEKDNLTPIDISNAYSILRLSLEHFLQKKLLKNIPYKNSFSARLREYTEILDSPLEERHRIKLKVIYEACNKSGPHLDHTGGDSGTNLKQLIKDFLEIENNY